MLALESGYGRRKAIHQDRTVRRLRIGRDFADLNPDTDVIGITTPAAMPRAT